LLARQDNRALIVFHCESMFLNNNPGVPVLILYDTDTQEVLWEYTQWATDLPYTLSNQRTRICNAYATTDRLLMLSSASDPYGGKTYTSCPLWGDVFSCSALVDFRALVIANRKTQTWASIYDDPFQRAHSSDRARPPGMFSSLVVGETSSHYLLPILHYNASQYRSSYWIIGLNKSTLLISQDKVEYTSTGWDTAGLMFNWDWGVNFQSMKNRILPNGDMTGGDNTIDGQFKLFTVLRDDRWQSAWWSESSAPFNIKSDDMQLRWRTTSAVYPYWRKILLATGRPYHNLALSFRRGYTSGYVLGASYVYATEGHEYLPITVPFNVRTQVVDEWNDIAIVVGAVDSGEIQYFRMTALGGRVNEIRAWSAETDEVYTVALAETPFGGAQFITFTGSEIVFRDLSGWVKYFTSGVTTDAWMSGGSGGAEPPPVIYDFEEMEFIPYPFAREGIRAELSNISKTCQVTLPETQTHFIKGLLAGGFDPRGARCILRRIFPDHAEVEGGSIILLDGYIQEWAYSPKREGIIFTISRTLLDVNNAFPKRLMNMGCSHVFRGTRCQYMGATGECLKTKTFCTSLGNVNQFGGFPWVASRQRRVMWR